MNTSYRCVVVIPTYNAEKYIEDVLASVFSQADVFLKVIVADDGSTDRTKEFIDKSPSRENINVVDVKRTETQQLRTASFGRNAALKYYLDNIEESFKDYNYICFLDHDDILAKDSVFKRVQALTLKSSDLVYSNTLKFSEALCGVREQKRKYIKDYKSLIKYALIRNINYNTIMITRDLLLKMVEVRKMLYPVNGLVFDEDIAWGEDRDVALLAINTCYKYGLNYTYLPDVTYFHREHKSLSSSIPSSLKSANYRLVDKRYADFFTRCEVVIERLLERPSYRLPRTIRNLSFVKRYEYKKYKKLTPLSVNVFNNLIFWYKQQPFSSV